MHLKNNIFIITSFHALLVEKKKIHFQKDSFIFKAILVLIKIYLFQGIFQM